MAEPVETRVALLEGRMANAEVAIKEHLVSDREIHDAMQATLHSLDVNIARLSEANGGIKSLIGQVVGFVNTCVCGYLVWKITVGH